MRATNLLLAAPAAQAGQNAVPPAAWIALALFLLAGAAATLYLLPFVARAILWAEKDDPYRRVLYEDERSGYWDYEPYALKKPGEPGYRPELGPRRRNPKRSAGRWSGPPRSRRR